MASLCINRTLTKTGINTEHKNVALLEDNVREIVTALGSAMVLGMKRIHVRRKR